MKMMNEHSFLSFSMDCSCNKMVKQTHSEQQSHCEIVFDQNMKNFKSVDECNGRCTAWKNSHQDYIEDIVEHCHWESVARKENENDVQDLLFFFNFFFLFFAPVPWLATCFNLEWTVAIFFGVQCMYACQWMGWVNVYVHVYVC